LQVFRVLLKGQTSYATLIQLSKVEQKIEKLVQHPKEYLDVRY